MWDQLMANIRRQITHSIYHVQLRSRRRRRRREPVGATAGRGAVPGRRSRRSDSRVGGRRPRRAAAGKRARRPVGAHKIGRNDPCPCGSGKKYKKCCGRTI